MISLARTITIITAFF